MPSASLISSAPSCGRCSAPIDATPQNRWGDGWACDSPTHEGANSFLKSEPQFCCLNYTTCNWALCKICWGRSVSSDSGLLSCGPCFKAGQRDQIQSWFPIKCSSLTCFGRVSRISGLPSATPALVVQATPDAPAAPVAKAASVVSCFVSELVG